MSPDEARDLLQVTEDEPRWVAEYGPLALLLLADTLEYGVENAAGDIEWFPVDANAGTAEDARLAAVNYAASDQFFRLVVRRVSEPWEVTDE